jgi:outer membrane protein assembly factor BamB/tetratricopeptide (TPR) repeat protein
MRDGDLSVDDFRAFVDAIPRATSSQNASDYLVYGGGPGRSARLAGGAPFLESIWRQKTISEGAVDTERQVTQAEALHAVPGRTHALLTGFFPVTATANKAAGKVPFLVYRSYRGIDAINLKTGRWAWKQESPWSMDKMYGIGLARDVARSTALSQWLQTYVQSGARPQAVFDNSVIGALSADSRHVYAVDDFQVPPPFYQPFNPLMGGGVNYNKEITDAIWANKLVCLNLASDGSLKWEVPGNCDIGLAKNHGDGKGWFLGAPLPLGNRLFALNERQQKLRILSLDSETGEVLSEQVLADVKDTSTIEKNSFRRTQAAHLAFGEGVLVVPTNAGAVFSIDVLSNKLMWAYPYRERGKAPGPQPQRFGPNPGPGWVRDLNGFWIRVGGMDSQWKTTAPVVQDGKVVFTAPDTGYIHCVSLREGSPVWTRGRQEEDLYLAGVFNGKVVIVGKQRAYALNLNTGDVVWNLETGLPSGVGAAAPLKKGEASDTIYYLPLKAAVRTGKPEICAINVDRGLVHAHTRSRKEDVVGNLLFYEGQMISQTTREVVGYPQLEVKLDQLNRELVKTPNDPGQLTERGDYLLDKGDLSAAILDFRKALKNKPTAEVRIKAREKLYDALTEYFQRDFNTAEKYLTEYEDLCKVEVPEAASPAERTAAQVEERRRRANFLCLVGKGREAQNKLVEAFRRYLELGETARRDELIQVVDEPAVKAAPDVWSQGRISAMVTNSKDGEQRDALEAEIKGRWAKIKATPAASTDDLRKFVRLFGSLFQVGKEARFALAERLMEDTDAGSLLEAEQHLNLLRGPAEDDETAARAVEALARLYTRKGFLEDAAFFYRMLGERYARTKIGDKTGADFLDDLSTDKRFLPYLDPPARFTARGKGSFEVLKSDSTAGFVPMTYTFTHDGERIPFFQKNLFGLRFSSPQDVLRITDASSGDERGALNLTRTQFQTIVSDWRAHPFTARYSYQTQGHLVVLQLGHMVFGIDPQGKGRVLWERPLTPVAGALTPASYHPDPRDGSVEVVYTDGWAQRLGGEGPLQGGVVCLLGRDALTAIDPVTGRTLWTRPDVNSRSVVFSDDKNIYVVGMSDGNNPTGTRAFRAYDGVSVKVRDFTHEFANRQRMLGRNVLVAETDARNALNLRIYDVRAGKNVWQHKFAPGAVQLRSEDPRLAGAIEPDGTVRVVDLTTTKEVLKAKMKWGKIAPKDLDKSKAVHMVSDSNAIYLAVNGPDDPGLFRPTWPQGMPPVQPMLAPGYGLRAVPVNGDLYAFQRGTGKLLWVNDFQNMTLTLAEFEEMPVVVLTGRYQKRIGFNNVGMAGIYVVQKRNGMYIFQDESPPSGAVFHAVQLDPRGGRFELLSSNLKLTIQPKRTGG